MKIPDSELDDLFKVTKAKIKNPDLLDILNRDYVYSRIKNDAQILVCGINPSYRADDPKKDEYNCFAFEHFGEKGSHYYFHKFHEMLGHYSNTATYLDIFYQRHRDQREIWKFVGDKDGLDFLCSQLVISQRKIENLRPKLILLFNRFAATFFGKNEKDGEHVWMGYDFAPVEGFKNLYQIKGLKQLEGRINQSLEHSAIEGRYILFSQYFDRRTKKETKDKIKEEIGKALTLALT